MDKASDYGSGDSRFESWQGRFFFFFSTLEIMTTPPAPPSQSAYQTRPQFSHVQYLVLACSCNGLNQPVWSPDPLAWTALRFLPPMASKRRPLSELLLACSVGDLPWVKKEVLAGGNSLRDTNREVSSIHYNRDRLETNSHTSMEQSV